MRVRGEVVVLLVSALLSWFFMISLEMWWGQRSSDEKLESEFWKNGDEPYPGNQARNIFWFLQVTDIHLSVQDNMSVARPLLQFCRSAMHVIRPSLILITGDITHAKFAGERRSQQFLVEWQAYEHVLDQCNWTTVPWLDIRGNHDCFDVPSLSDSSNYFAKYATSERKNRKTHTHTSKAFSYMHHTPFGKYEFIAIDACPDPGPRRPFNFFGVLYKEDLAAIKELMNKEVNQTILFTHYPSAIITTDHEKLQELLRSCVAHLCGHLHTVGGMHHMYARHPAGHLELELGDFTGQKRFRLLAFDHDLLSFVDATLEEWPIILITNPKDAQFLVPTREPIGRMLQSSHVRILIFSPYSIKSVQLRIDGTSLPDPHTVEGGPLYVTPWQPTEYKSGLHKTFSLDNSLSPMEFLPQFILVLDIRSLVRWTFAFVWSSLLLCLAWAWSNFPKRSCLHNFVGRKDLFYPYLAFVVYFGIGPWHVGEIISKEYGFVCVHGVYVLNSFIPGSMTYFYGTIQVVLVHIPLLLCLNYIVRGSSSTWRGASVWMILIGSLLLQLYWGFACTYPYGTVAMLFSPGGLWPVLLSSWLVYTAFKKAKITTKKPHHNDDDARL